MRTTRSRLTPAKLTGALIGYARVSTSGQILDRQTRALTEAGCIRVFADKLSGKTADGPSSPRAWTTCARATPLVVPSLDRLSRSLQDLITAREEHRNEESRQGVSRAQNPKAAQRIRRQIPAESA